MFYKPCDPLVLALPPGQGYENAVRWVTGRFPRSCSQPYTALKQHADNSPDHRAALRLMTKRVTFHHHRAGMRLRRLARQLELLQAEQHRELSQPSPRPTRP
jgi:hypothetical protein